MNTKPVSPRSRLNDKSPAALVSSKSSAGCGTLGPVPTVLKPKRILVPIDFSDCSRKALKYALPFARQFHAAITLLHAVHVDYHAASSEYTTFDYPELIGETQRAGEKQLRDLARSVREAGPVKTVIQTGHPGSVIVDTARKLGVDLIVISTHGRTGFKRAFFGSTTEHVVRYAPCPVLIVREHEHEFVQPQPLNPRGSKR